jgi:hypothetical protein
MNASEAPAVPTTAETPVDLMAPPETDTRAITEQPDEGPQPREANQADWTTIGSLIVALLSLALLYRQLQQNRLSHERQLRAYLAVRPLGVTKLIGSDFVLGQVLLRNVGSTLAKNVSLEVNAGIEPHRNRTEFRVGGDTEIVARALQPGDEMPQGSGNSLLFGDIQSPANHIYIWGVAHYDDGFGKRRFTRFCHRYACASHDRAAFRKAQAKGVREALTIIGADKARLNEIGNDAD